MLNQHNRRRLEKGAFFVRRACLDVVRPNRFGVSKRYKPGDRGTDSTMPYVLGYARDRMFDVYGMKYDSDGVVLTRHYIHQGEGHYYDPVKIAHFGLAALNDALGERDPNALADYRTQIRWIMDSYTQELGGAVWRVPTTNPKYELGQNFISCISQGLSLSLLARAESPQDRRRAAELSEAAISPLLVSVEEGGLLSHSRWGPCFEEYPCFPQSHVINGFVFCLNGLFDAYSAYGLSKTRELFDIGLATLREMTKVWFVGGWARYDLRDVYTGEMPNLATRHYQYLHADQMRGLAIITGDEFWARLSRKFELQAVNPVGIAQAYYCKARKFL